MMPDFNNQWIEIFRAGDYGDKGKWTPEMLATVVKNFDSGAWIPPAVFGHPQEDSPAHGWVKSLAVDGGVLKAQFKQVTPELEAKAREGRFPNRSAAFYRDPKGSGPVLRHVGFLGATPPEVKGLEPIHFSDGDFLTIEFTEEGDVDPKEIKKTVVESIREYFGELFGEKKPASAAAFTEEDRKKLIEDAQKPFLEKIDALTKKFDESVTQAKASATAATESERKAAVKAFIAGLVAKNRWVPAFAEAGLDRVLEHLAIAGSTVKFGEAGKEKEVSLYDLHCQFLEALPEIVPTAVLAVKGKGVKGKNVLQFTEAKTIGLDEGSVTVRARAIEIQEKNPKMAFGECLRQARAEVGEPAAAAGGVAAGAV
jgi:hypothetical protein